MRYISLAEQLLQSTCFELQKQTGPCPLHPPTFPLNLSKSPLKTKTPYFHFFLYHFFLYEFFPLSHVPPSSPPGYLCPAGAAVASLYPLLPPLPTTGAPPTAAWDAPPPPPHLPLVLSPLPPLPPPPHPPPPPPPWLVGGSRVTTTRSMAGWCHSARLFMMNVAFVPWMRTASHMSLSSGRLKVRSTLKVKAITSPCRVGWCSARCFEKALDWSLERIQAWCSLVLVYPL